MLVACWSVKGGSGTTVVSAALALLLARSSAEGALLVDLAGDSAAALGVGDDPTLGVWDWVRAGDSVGAEALRDLEVAVSPSLRLLPPGIGGVADRHAQLEPDRVRDRRIDGARADTTPPNLVVLPGGRLADHTARLVALTTALATDPRPVIVDCGSTVDDSVLPVVRAATVSLLVIRPCYLAVRRALKAPVVASGIVLVGDPGRSLAVEDVQTILRVPVRAKIDHDPQIARAVDAGLLTARLPRGLSRPLRHAA